MLNMLIGRSGTGKTTALYRELKERAAKAEPLFLLVPEQASFENERRLLTELGPMLSQRVRVTSFTDMTRTVFREVGGLGGRRMDPTLSLLLISQALHSVADRLTVYQRHVDSPDYLQALAGMLRECKQCAITPMLMNEVSSLLPEGLLRGKLTELSLIFEAYEALVAQAELIDPLDDLTWLAQVLPDCHAFDGAHVYVDGFKGFTKQELTVLEQLMPRVASLTVVLCTDTVTVREGQEYDRFAVAIRTAADLRDAAYRAHVPVTAPQTFTDVLRTSDPALRALEQGCFALDTPSFDEPTEAVTVTPCTDREAECRYAARLIRRTLRENGGYARDYTIVARDMAAYADLMEAALQLEGIPCCRDYREPIATQPLITLVGSALAAIVRGFDTNDVLRIVGSGLAGFSATSAAQLENYAFVWNIRYGQWRQPFTEHPDGLTATADERSDNRLAQLERLRRRLIDPLEALASRLSDRCNGRQFADAVYRFLTELRVARSVRLRVAQLDADGEPALAEHQARMWDYLMGLLDKFAAALADTVLPVARFEELFRLAVSSDDLGSIPQGLDGVVIGAVDRIRYTRPRTVIVLGANEGVLPAYPSSSGMLTDYERRQLIRVGLPMVNGIDHQTAEERFFAYAAVAAPSERLIVTYAQKSGKNTLFPSSLVAEIDRLVPKHAIGNAQSASESEADAFAVFAATHRRRTAEAAAYREVFETLPDYRGRLVAIDRIEDGFAFLDPQAAHDHFGDTLYLSPTQVEKFFKCRFQYFCSHTLSLKHRQVAEVKPTDAGTLAHKMLQDLIPVYYEADIATITRAQVEADAAQFVKDYVENYMGGKGNRDARFYALMDRLAEQCALLLWHAVFELQQSRFVPTHYELSFGKKDTLPAWKLTLPSGTTVLLCGSIDRVDTYKKDGKTFVRVVDYKTGKRDFDVAGLLAGLDLQLPIYLFAMCENGKKLHNNLVPSGMFYSSAKAPKIKPAASDTPEKIEKKKLKALRMTGLALDDPDVLQAMERDLEGLFIPVSMKSGEITTDYLVSLAEFGTLREHVQTLLDNMATMLQSGDIAAVPSYQSQYPPCAYCDFHDICGREGNDPEKKLEKIALGDALAAMKEVADDE